MIDLNYTNEELNALEFYINGKYEAINQMLVSDCESDIALLSDETENKSVEISYSRSSVIENLRNIKLIYKLILKACYKNPRKKITLYRGTNIAEVERIRNEVFIDKFLIASDIKEKAEDRYAAGFNRPASINMTLDDNIPYIYVDDIFKDGKEKNTVIILPFTKIRKITESLERQLGNNSKYLKTFDVELEKQELDPLTDQERNGLYAYILDNAYFINKKIEDCIKLEKENAVNFESIRKLEQLLNKYETAIEEKENNPDYSDIERENDASDVARVKRELEELKEVSTNLFELRKENIEFVNIWKRNIAVYMIAECKEIEKLFNDLVLPEPIKECNEDGNKTDNEVTASIVVNNIKEENEIKEVIDSEEDIIETTEKDVVIEKDIGIDTEKDEIIEKDTDVDIEKNEIIEKNTDTDTEKDEIIEKNADADTEKDEVIEKVKIEDDKENTTIDEVNINDNIILNALNKINDVSDNILDIDVKENGLEFKNLDEESKEHLEVESKDIEQDTDNTSDSIEGKTKLELEIESKLKSIEESFNREKTLATVSASTMSFDNKQDIQETKIVPIVERIEVREIDDPLYKRVKVEAKENVEAGEKLLEDINSLITKQQNHAKIAGNMGASYSALNNAFDMRKSAESLLELLKNINLKVKALCEHEKNKDIEDNLERISKSNIEINTLINYLNNPKIAVRNSKVNRFDEIAIIEENELKRGIAEKIREIRGEAELKKLKDDLEIIEDKGTLSRIIGMITGRNKLDDLMIDQIEIRQKAIRRTLSKKLSLARNYSIHELLAEIVMFIDENEDDELVENDVAELKKLAEELRRNYIVLESKVQSIVEEKEGSNLPLDDRKISKQEMLEIETYRFLNRYGYDLSNNDKEEPKYQDTMASEIARIIEYINSSRIL